MAVALALLAALAWGSSDFLGGLAARRSPGDMSVTIGLTTSLAGAAFIAVVAPLGGGTFPQGPALWAALGGGAGGGLAITALYRGLERGRMGVVAPVTGVLAASLPAVAGAVQGERLPWTAWLGFVLALAAIALVSREPDPPPSLRALAVGITESPRGRERLFPVPMAAGIPEALFAGVGFAAFFILLDYAGDGAGLWPLIPVKVGAILMLAAVLLVVRPTTGVGPAAGDVAATEDVRQPFLPPRGLWGLVVAVGAIDLLANGMFLVAAQTGLLTVVAVLSSLYPAATVVLARFVLHEHLARHQVAALPLALVAVVLVASA